MSFVDDLEMSVRSGNVLRRAEIKTASQLLALTKEEVLQMPAAGIRTWREVSEIQEVLRKETGPTTLWARFTTAVQDLNAFMEEFPEHRVVLEGCGFLIPVRSGELDAKKRLL